jgi:2-succinyl-6-hydroxy-2,4-cyclohexadiene-1-carboxylate synthase
VAGLGLIACSAGIESAAERAERRRADAKLAAQLEAGGLDAFIARWAQQPLFADDPPRVRELAQADQRRNRAEALAGALRGIGAGEMQPLWVRLGELDMPALVIVGERDSKYLALGRRMVELLADGELVVVPGGHRLALENPAAVARALQRLDAEPGRRG